MFEPTFLTIAAIWVASEAGLVIFRRADASSDRRDAGTLRLLNVVIYASVGLGIYIGASGRGHVRMPGAAGWAGLGAIALGLALRWWAVLSLRRFFTVDVAIQPDHHLVRSGPYRFVRHPAYAGSLLSFAGLAVSLSSWLSALVILVPIVAVFHFRMRVEEDALLAALSDEYREYSARTARIVPGVY